MERRKSEREKEMAIVRDMAERMRKLLGRVNKEYWKIYIMLICSIIFLILYTIIVISIFGESELYVEPIPESLPMEYYLAILYFIFLLFILPVTSVYVIYWFMSKKAPFMEDWEDIKSKVQSFDKALSNNADKDFIISDLILESIFSYEKWLKTLWVNRCFFLIFLLFSINLFIFTPFTVYPEVYWSGETGWMIEGFDVGIWALSIWPISFVFPSILIYLLCLWYYQKEIKLWEPRIMKVKDKFNQFMNGYKLEAGD